MSSRDRARMGPYELLGELHRGGMGSVLLGRRTGPGGFEKLVAIKTILRELEADIVHRQMFLDEARLVARLVHPAIAQVFDVGQAEGTLFIAMELVHGVTLRDTLVRRNGSLPLASVIELMIRILEGLHAAHELTDERGLSLGVVHRDVSPNNVMLTFDGEVKIIDFGIARMSDRLSPHTRTGSLRGKPGYMAPEQLDDGLIDRRTDVFLAGILLHELATGRRLFEAGSLPASLNAVLHRPIPLPSSCRPDLPAGLDAIALRALARNPEERYPSALELARALQALPPVRGPALALFAARELVDERRSFEERLRRLRAGEAGNAQGSAIPAALRSEGRETGVETKPVAAPRSAALREPGRAFQPRLAGGPRPNKPRRSGRLVGAALALVLVLGGSAAWFWARSERSELGEHRAGGTERVEPPAREHPHDAEAGTVADSGGATRTLAHQEPEAAEKINAVRPPLGRSRPRRSVRAPRTRSPDASTSAEQQARGTLIIVRPLQLGFVDVFIDRRPVGRSNEPIPVSGGRHRVELYSPATGALLSRRVVMILPGQVTRVHLP